MFLLFKCCILSFMILHCSVTSWETAQEFQYELPIKSEIQSYVRVLQNIINFYRENIDKISMSVAFGLFIGNVHLGRAMKDFKKAPLSIQNEITDIYQKSEDIIKYQWNFVQRKSATQCPKLSKLFNNVSAWSDRVEKFQPPREKYRILDALEVVYRGWRRYAQVAQLRYVQRWTPVSKRPGPCLESLLAADNVGGDFQICNIDSGCHEALKNRSDAGYELCHRILILLIAHTGFGCSIFSPPEDRKLLNNFCSMGYAEAQYIVYKNYVMVDLLLEYMSLCALAGRTEFLRRSWLSDILKLQTKHGCFSQDMQESAEPLEKQSNGTNDLRGGQCSGHTTALASSSLAAAVRYILEKFY